MKNCIFYYIACAQVNIVSRLEDIEDPMDRIQGFLAEETQRQGIPRSMSLFSSGRRTECLVWNRTYIDNKLSGTGSRNLNADDFKPFMKTSDEKIEFNTDIVYKAANHKDDALKYLLNIGRSFIIYYHTEQEDLAQYHDYYNRYKNIVSVRPNEEFWVNKLQKHKDIKYKIDISHAWHKMDVYNSREYFGVKLV